MKRINRALSFILASEPLLGESSGCAIHLTDAGLIETVRAITAFTAEVIPVEIRPVQFLEHFDIISAENAPVSFDAFFIANVIPGRSPELFSRFGPQRLSGKFVQE